MTKPTSRFFVQSTEPTHSFLPFQTWNKASVIAGSWSVCFCCFVCFLKYADFDHWLCKAAPHTGVTMKNRIWVITEDLESFTMHPSSGKRWCCRRCGEHQLAALWNHLDFLPLFFFPTLSNNIFRPWFQYIKLYSHHFSLLLIHYYKSLLIDWLF